MRTCHLHLGLHKAASTTLQAMVLANHDRLAAHGIYVPRTRTNGYTRAHHLLAWEFFRRSARNVEPGGFEELRQELEDRKSPDEILISSEDFEWCLTGKARLRRLCRLFEDMGYRLRLIAYIRPQVGSLNSAYTQRTKMLAPAIGFDAFVADLLERPRFHYGASMLQVLKMNRCDVVYRPFSREVLDNGIARDFLSTLGLDEAAVSSMEIPVARNTRPGPKTVAACNELARRLSEGGIELDRETRRLASHAMLKTSERLDWNRTGFSGVDAPLAELIRERFAAGNAIFAETVWKRSWEDVFGADCWDPPALNVFDPRTADRQEAGEFDEVVERAWRRLRDGDVKGLAADAGLSPNAATVSGWLGQIKAALAG